MENIPTLPDDIAKFFVSKKCYIKTSLCNKKYWSYYNYSKDWFNLIKRIAIKWLRITKEQSYIRNLRKNTPNGNALLDNILSFCDLINDKCESFKMTDKLKVENNKIIINRTFDRLYWISIEIAGFSDFYTVSLLNDDPDVDVKEIITARCKSFKNILKFVMPFGPITMYKCPYSCLSVVVKNMDGLQQNIVEAFAKCSLINDRSQLLPENYGNRIVLRNGKIELVGSVGTFIQFQNDIL